MKILKLFLFAALHFIPLGLACAQDGEPADQPVAASLDAEGKQVVEGINQFSLDLYRASLAPRQNLFISPASVSTAVALAYRGAQGSTAIELRSALHYFADPRRYLQANSAVLATLNFAGNGRELRVTNALWLQQGMPLRPDFAADIDKYARAGLQRVDYRNDTGAARLEINQWVADATNDKIRDLLSEDDVTDRTRAALVNSIYWKGRWASGFSPEATKTEPFTPLDGKQLLTTLMHQRASFQSVVRNGVRAIQLRYMFNEVAMVILMPDDASGLPQFERKLTSDDLTHWLKELDAASFRDTVLTLPKMHLEWRNDIVPALKTLGAPTPFSDEADFNGIAEFPYPGEVPEAAGLKIRKVIHQTFLDVDEKGSEAAAATAVMMDIIVTSARTGPPPPPPFIFRADKPFLFLLRDTRTNAILFIGRFVTPSNIGK